MKGRLSLDRSMRSAESGEAEPRRPPIGRVRILGTSSNPIASAFQLMMTRNDGFFSSWRSSHGQAIAEDCACQRLSKVQEESNMAAIRIDRGTVSGTAATIGSAGCSGTSTASLRIRVRSVVVAMPEGRHSPSPGRPPPARSAGSNTTRSCFASAVLPLQEQVFR